MCYLNFKNFFFLDIMNNNFKNKFIKKIKDVNGII